MIVAGDLNATDQNYAYELIAEELHDAWRQGGFELGTRAARLAAYSIGSDHRGVIAELVIR